MDTDLPHVLCCAAWSFCGATACEHALRTHALQDRWTGCRHRILAEGAIALSVTLSGGALFAN